MSQQQIMWQPDQQAIASANITSFSQFVAGRHGVAMVDYHDLQRWSLQHPADFLAGALGFHRRVGERGDGPVLVDGDKMPGAQWFPDARLNYAENLLHWADETPERTAVLFANESGLRSSYSFAELRQQSEQMALVLQSMGVVAGDRVAGYLPNLPETLIAMLAATRLGAIWSSCSPDFGVNAVCDRFGQIQPKVMVAAAASLYNDKTHDCSSNIVEISQRIDSIEHIIVVPYVASDESVQAARAHRTRCCGMTAWTRLHSGLKLVKLRPIISDWRSIIRCISCFPPAPPACPNASPTVPAARCCST